MTSLLVALVFFFSDHEARLDVLGTGRVAVALCDVPGGGDVLVNAGDAGAARRVVKWLHARGVDRLRALVLTAATADVAGAAPEILDQVPVEELWIGPQPARSKIFQAALDSARARGLVVRTLACGDRGCLAGGVEWEVLHPARSDARAAAADGSLVLRFARAASSVLMASPSSVAEQEAIVARPVEVTAGVLVMDEPPGPAMSRAAGGAAVLIPGPFEETVVRFDDRRGVELVRVED